LEGTFKDDLAQSPCHGQGHLPLDQVSPPNLTLNASSDGASTASLGNLVWCESTIIKKFLSYVHSKPIGFQFKTVAPCSVTTGLGKKSPSVKKPDYHREFF